MKLAHSNLPTNSHIFLLGQEMGITVIHAQKSKSHKEFSHLGAKALNILLQSLRASQSVKSFSTAYKNAPLEKLQNDELYQTNNSFEKFYLISS